MSTKSLPESILERLETSERRTEILVQHGLGGDEIFDSLRHYCLVEQRLSINSYSMFSFFYEQRSALQESELLTLLEATPTFEDAFRAGYSRPSIGECTSELLASLVGLGYQGWHELQTRLPCPFVGLYWIALLNLQEREEAQWLDADAIPSEHLYEIASWTLSIPSRQGYFLKISDASFAKYLPAPVWHRACIAIAQEHLVRAHTIPSRGLVCMYTPGIGAYWSQSTTIKRAHHTRAAGAW